MGSALGLGRPGVWCVEWGGSGCGAGSGEGMEGSVEGVEGVGGEEVAVMLGEGRKWEGREGSGEGKGVGREGSGEGRKWLYCWGREGSEYEYKSG